MDSTLVVIVPFLLFFGLLFIAGALTPNGSLWWLPIGIISIALGFGIIWFVNRRNIAKSTDDSSNTKTLDLHGNIELEIISCQNCGGTLSPEDIKIVEESPLVNCPYCGTSYLITREEIFFYSL